MNIFLIGYRGSGKTTVGRRLAERLGWPWLDADAVLEARAGKSIKQIFEQSGEQAFRDLESAVVADLALLDNHVIALGGGAVLREENRQALAGRGHVVWLEASPETLAARIAADPATSEQRPNLTGQGGLAEIRSLLAQRAPVYRRCASLVLDAERLGAAELAERIAGLLFPQAPSPAAQPHSERNPA